MVTLIRSWITRSSAEKKKTNKTPPKPQRFPDFVAQKKNSWWHSTMRFFTDNFPPWYMCILATESVFRKGFNYFHYKIFTDLKGNGYLDYWHIASFFNLHKAWKHATRQLEVPREKQLNFTGPSPLFFALIPQWQVLTAPLQTCTQEPTKMSSFLISVNQMSKSLNHFPVLL